MAPIKLDSLTVNNALFQPINLWSPPAFSNTSQPYNIITVRIKKRRALFRRQFRPREMIILLLQVDFLSGKYSLG